MRNVVFRLKIDGSNAAIHLLPHKPCYTRGQASLHFHSLLKNIDDGRFVFSANSAILNLSQFTIAIKEDFICALYKLTSTRLLLLGRLVASYGS